MNTKEFSKTQREKMLKKISHLEKDVKDSEKYDDVGSTTEDEIIEFEEFEEKTALAKDNRKELAELKAAIKRIDDGTYGICEKCKGKIEEARLVAFPQSRFCASDK